MSIGRLARGYSRNPYQLAICIEFAHQSIRFETEQDISLLLYRGVNVGKYRPDIVVEGAVVVEVKSVLKFEPVFVAQMLTYLRLTKLKRGLILNFNRSVLKAGITRVSL
jgi:GxxExxY protein